MQQLKLKKNEDRRIRAGHPWIFSNEIDNHATPLKSFVPGEDVVVIGHDNKPIGKAYMNPHSLIAARIYSYDLDQSLNTDFFIEKLQTALKLRERLFSKPFYRFIFSEADRLPGLVIDRFDTTLVMQINTAGMETKQTELAEAIRQVLPETQAILLRNDSQIRQYEGLETYIKPLFGTPPDVVTLEENDVRFLVPIWKGQKTGWFYDHRQNRAQLKNFVLGKRVLDVFSYLGGFGIQAAVFGANQVDCIETSAFAGDFIRENAKLNTVDSKVNVISADVFDGMKALSQTDKLYNVITLDPPAFVKKFKDRKEGLVAYQRVNELALKLLTQDGVLVTCSCSMHVSEADLIQILQRAAFNTKSQIQIIGRGHQGPDHPIHAAIPETDYLKAIFVRKI